MKKKPHPADLAELAMIAKATSFSVFLKMGQGTPLKFERATLAEAVKIALALEAQNKPKRSLVYGIFEGASYVVPRAMVEAEAAKQIKG